MNTRTRTIVIGDVEHQTGRLDLDYELGTMVIDVDLAHLVGDEITFRVGGDLWYVGAGVVSEVHIPADGPVFTAVRLNGPLVKEPTQRD